MINNVNTLIKTKSSLPNNNQKFLGELAPFGSAMEVTNRMLDIPHVKIAFFSQIEQGNVTLLWDIGNVAISYQEEPNFGSQDVFIITLDKILLNKEFFNFYSKVFEQFGCVLLYKRAFITVENFKKFV